MQAAEDLAKEAGPNADKLNAKVMETADQVSKNAIPVAQDLEKNLRFQARDASENAEDVGNVVSNTGFHCLSSTGPQCFSMLCACGVEAEVLWACTARWCCRCAASCTAQV